MKNLSNYINERLVLAKDGDKTLSKAKLKRNECVIRVSDFYCWYFGVDSFDDIKLTQDMIDDYDPWFEQEEDGSFKNQYEVYDFIKDFVDDGEDYVIARQKDLGNCINVSFKLDGINFEHDCEDFIPDNIIIRKNK